MQSRTKKTERLVSSETNIMERERVCIMMIRLLRRHMKKIFIAILVLIIPAFCFWGVFTTMKTKKQTTTVAYVGNKKISQAQFSELSHHAEIHYILQLVKNSGIRTYADFERQKNFFMLYLKFFNKEQATFERLLYLREAAAYSIKISKEELTQWILSFPLFHNEQNTFDEQLYTHVVKEMFRDSFLSFEEALLDNLKIERLKEMLTASAVVSPLEMEEQFQSRYEKMQASYITVSASEMPQDINVSEEDMHTYYQAHKEDFTIPDQIQCGYIIFSAQDYRQEITITTEQAQQHYEQNKTRYVDPTTKEPVAFDTVQESIVQELTEQQLNTLIQDKALDFSILLTKGTSLKKAAESRGIPYHITDYFSNDDLLPQPIQHPAFKKSALSLNKGQISDLISMNNAVALAEYIDKKPAYIPEEKEITTKLRTALINTKTRTAAAEKAASYKKALTDMLAQEHCSFADAAAKLHLSIHTPPPFARTDVMKDIPNASLFITEAFKTPVGSISDPIAAEDTFFLIYPEKKLPPEPEQWVKEEKKIYESVLREKKARILQNSLNALLTKYRLNIVTTGLNKEEKPEQDSPYTPPIDID